MTAVYFEFIHQLKIGYNLKKNNYNQKEKENIHQECTLPTEMIQIGNEQQECIFFQINSYVKYMIGIEKNTFLLFIWTWYFEI